MGYLGDRIPKTEFQVSGTKSSESGRKKGRTRVRPFEGDF